MFGLKDANIFFKTHRKLTWRISPIASQKACMIAPNSVEKHDGTQEFYVMAPVKNLVVTAFRNYESVLLGLWN